MKAIALSVVITAFTILIFSCRKSEFLDANPNDFIIVPEKISDLQAILDNTSYMNGDQFGVGLNPIIGEAASDNYYIDPDRYGNLTMVSAALQNIYTWNDTIYNMGMVQTDWGFPYRAVFYANSVINTLPTIKDNTATQVQINNVEGSALFFRAEMFYQLAQIFAPHYKKDSAAIHWGIPLQSSADINEPVQRASVAKTYEQVITDLKTAIPLLPVIPQYKTRPSKPAACALLARVYLTMQEYDSAIVYAGACLQIHDKLVDYRLLQNNQIPDFKLNDEVIFHSNLVNTAIFTLFNTFISRVDSTLYSQYEQNDLRRVVFFSAASGGHSFKGNYSGNSKIMWGGIATDEVLLTRAECYARRGNTGAALADLNSLLEKRFATGTFVPYTTSDPIELRQLILAERRKELLFRGLRWTDLRRLNSDGANITITRNVAGKIYELSPGNLKYTFLIPPEVIGFNPGMPQNPR